MLRETGLGKGGKKFYMEEGEIKCPTVSLKLPVWPLASSALGFWSSLEQPPAGNCESPVSSSLNTPLEEALEVVPLLCRSSSTDLFKQRIFRYRFSCIFTRINLQPYNKVRSKFSRLLTAVTSISAADGRSVTPSLQFSAWPSPDSLIIIQYALMGSSRTTYRNYRNRPSLNCSKSPG